MTAAPRVSAVRGWLKLVLTVVALMGLFVCAVWLAQHRLIYFPDRHAPAPAAFGLPDAEVVALRTDDGLTLGGWFVSARTSPRTWTLVVFNGNAGHRGYRASLAERFADQGYSTLLFDYRGFGGNAGSPSEEGLARDARAALQYVASRADVDRSRIAYFGESLGAAVAVRLAVDDPPAAVILRSPFSSLAALGASHYPFLPVRWMLKDRYPSVEHIRALRSPLLIIAGDADRIVPLEDSHVLFAAAPMPKQFVTIAGAGHNDAALAIGPQVIQAIAGFLGRLDRERE